jgi:hypothetical protein
LHKQRKVTRSRQRAKYKTVPKTFSPALDIQRREAGPSPAAG